MAPGDPRSLLNRHATRIFARWRELLRALPPSSALADPDLLAPQMAPALARVKHEACLVPDVALPEPTPADCRCGLNPLVAFYLTGECATFEVLWARPDGFAQLTPPEREIAVGRLRAAWRHVADDEIALFCSICQHGKPHPPKQTDHSGAAADAARTIPAPAG